MDSRLMTPQRIMEQNRCFKGTGGLSQENRSSGFLPAFSDTRNGTVYLSCFADGTPAPVHMLDGLPSDLIIERSASGRVTAVMDCIQAGFVRQGQFYTREQAAMAATGH
jgi:hypothetical protein